MCGWGEVGKGNTIAHGFSIDVVSLQHIECPTCGSNMRLQTYVVSLQQEGQLLYILLRQAHHAAQAHLAQAHHAALGHSAVDVC